MSRYVSQYRTDGYGQRYVINQQTGKVLLPPSKPSRALVQDCAMALALRNYARAPETVRRLVNKLNNNGWWADHIMRCAFGPNWKTRY